MISAQQKNSYTIKKIDNRHLPYLHAKLSKIPPICIISSNNKRNGVRKIKLSTRTKNTVAGWFPQIDPKNRPELDRNLTAVNFGRLKIVAWLYMATMLLSIGIDYTALTVIEPNRGAGWLLPFVTELRVAMALGSAMFLILARRPRPPEMITGRHRLIERGFLLFIIYWSAVMTGLLQPVQPTIAPYLVAILIATPFSRLPLAKSILFYTSGGVVAAVSILHFGIDWFETAVLLFNCLLSTLAAIIFAQVFFVLRVNSFLNMKLIERQKEELSRANEMLAESNQMLQRLSYLDALTDVPNRRYFDEVLGREYKRAARTKTTLSLIMADIDHFKDFNDTYGHQEGDKCLVEVAAAISSRLKRPGDIAARYGGEEFAAVLPRTSPEDAFRLAEEMRRAVTDLGLSHEGSAFEKVTISLGVAWHDPPQEDGVEGLIKAADQALYLAKGGGRNRTVVADIK